MLHHMLLTVFCQTHISNYYHNEWGAPLAKKLVESTSFASKVFYCNSGCEANEAALKFARKHAVVVSGAVVDPHTATNTNKKTKIVAFSSSFHGRTAGALSATAKLQYRLPFEPLVHGVSFAAYNDAEAAAKLVDDECAAVIVEPVQGEGGVTPASREFLQALRALCDKHHAALIFDEVQIGLARSGKLWCHEHAGVSPDILSFAKPIAAGLPMGGVLMAPHIAKAVVAGDHGTTFGGGPLVTRAAYLVLQRLSKETFLEDVREKANYLKESLEEATAAHQASGLIQQVRGLGLLQGLVLTKPVKPVIEHSREHANVLFINAGDNVLRLAPPLTVSKSEIDEAVSAIAAALAAY
eukprot:TRINITY_DN233_c0_g1_i2.p1 TRINITY_DN233_c0_g1~~TRINITY_DN233_c0_g1_i2.p1  ORF type:complete len:354 (-),score=125.14 TRINITY_DN233_c0_g1_i2:280-1341(-)